MLRIGIDDAKAGAGAAVRLAEVGPARLLEPLDRSGRVGQADLGELGVDVAPAALEHAEDVARRDDVPGRQRVELGEHAARALLGGDLAADRRLDPRRLAVAGIGFAEQVVLERQDAVIVGGAAPQHRAGRHDRALGRLDDLDMAGAAGLARDAIVGRVDEADEFGRLAVEQGVAAPRIGADGQCQRLGIARQHMRLVARRDIGRVVVRRARDRRAPADCRHGSRCSRAPPPASGAWCGRRSRCGRTGSRRSWPRPRPSPGCAAPARRGPGCSRARPPLPSRRRRAGTAPISAEAASAAPISTFLIRLADAHRPRLSRSGSR